MKRRVVIPYQYPLLANTYKKHSTISYKQFTRALTRNRGGSKCFIAQKSKIGLKLTRERSSRYTTKTITDADYADDIELLANAPAQAETLLHILERAAADIGVYVNAHKTEYMCFNQTGDISTLNGSSLKLVDKFTYLGSSVSSTETDINSRLAKA